MTTGIFLMGAILWCSSVVEVCSSGKVVAVEVCSSKVSGGGGGVQ